MQYSKSSIDKRQLVIGFHSSATHSRIYFCDLGMFGNSIQSGLIRRISRRETAD